MVKYDPDSPGHGQLRDGGADRGGPGVQSKPDGWLAGMLATLLKNRGINLIWQSARTLDERNGIQISGHIAFTTMLALFPFLIFLVSVAGFVGDTRTGQDFLVTLELIAPPDVVKTLEPAIQQVIQNRNGSLLTISLLLSLYSAASGVDAVRLALNLAYGVEETRSFWFRKAQDFLIVIFGSVIVILASVVIILGPMLWHVIAWFTHADASDRTLWHLARYGFTFIAMTAAVMALHRILPDTQLRLRTIFPGALATTILWLIAASLLTLYLGSIANYTATYGSLGGAVITLLFFYISAIIFIWGGEFNARLASERDERRRRRA